MEFVEMVIKMREAQKEFYWKRTRPLFNEMKKWERLVDTRLLMLVHSPEQMAMEPALQADEAVRVLNEVG